MTPEDLAAIRARHVLQPSPGTYRCLDCHQAWPCPDILAVEKWGVK